MTRDLGCLPAPVISADRAWRVTEFGCARYQADRLDLALQLTDRTHCLELHLRDAIAIALKRKVLKDGIGDTAIGRCIALPLLCLNERVGQLRLVAKIDPDGKVALIDLLAVSPDAFDQRYWSLGNRHRKTG